MEKADDLGECCSVLRCVVEVVCTPGVVGELGMTPGVCGGVRPEKYPTRAGWLGGRWIIMVAKL